MLDRDTVRRRLEGDGISYTEFSYMLLQANDYVRAAPAVRMRAADRRLGSVGQHHRRGSAGPPEAGATVHALTTPLVTDSEGKKFGKSTGGGSLWLDPEMTSPYAWYQYFVNTADADVVRVPAVVHLPVARRAGRTGAGDRGAAARASGAAPAGPRADHAGARGGGDGRGRTCQPGAVRPGGAVPARRADAGGRAAGGSRWPNSSPAGPTRITDLLVASGLSASKGAARRTIGEGGAYVNNVRIDSEEWVPQPSDFLHGRWLVLRRGKRNIAGVERVG